MDSFLVILLVIGLIAWLENTRLNKSIRQAWKNLEDKPIVQSLKNPQSLIKIRKYLRQDVEIELLKLGIDATHDDESLKPNSKEEQALSEILSGYTITMNPSVREVVDKVVIKLKTPKKTTKLNTTSNEMNDAKSALKSLGYKDVEIKKVTNEIVNTMGSTMKSGEIITAALRILNA